MNFQKRFIFADAALLLVFVGATFASTLYWLLKYRFGLSLDIDEAGYITMAMNDARNFELGGVRSFINAVSSPTAPVFPFLTSMLMIPFGRHEILALWVNPLLGCVLIVFIYLLVVDLTDRTTALAAALLVGTIPSILDYERSAQFSMAAALFFVTAVYSYHKSNAFDRLGWSLAFGVSAALMILSRTMTIAFLPIMGLVPFLHMLLSRQTERQRWRNITFGAIAFLLVAGPWYYVNYTQVLDYLFSFGYGAHASEYGANNGIFSWDNAKSRFDQLIASLLVPHFLFLAAAIVLSVLAFIWKRNRPKGSFVIIGFALVALGYLVLATSRNRGSGFDLPLLPILIAMAVVWLSTSFAGKTASRLILAIAIVVSLPVLISKTDMRACSVMPTSLTTPVIGDRLWFDCRGNIQRYVASSGIVEIDRISSFDRPPLERTQEEAWREYNGKLTRALHTILPDGKSAVFATRQYLSNVNNVQLQSATEFGSLMSLGQIEPNVLENTTSGYVSWLAPAGSATNCVVALATTNEGEFNPKPSTQEMTAALIRLGYSVVAKIPTPITGQQMQLWSKREVCG